jgi:hypothetical protein
MRIKVSEADIKHCKEVNCPHLVEYKTANGWVRGCDWKSIILGCPINTGEKNE